MQAHENVLAMQLVRSKTKSSPLRMARTMELAGQWAAFAHSSLTQRNLPVDLLFWKSWVSGERRGISPWVSFVNPWLRLSFLRCPVEFHGKKRIGILSWLVQFKEAPFPKNPKKERKKGATGQLGFKNQAYTPSLSECMPGLVSVLPGRHWQVAQVLVRVTSRGCQLRVGWNRLKPNPSKP